MKSLLFQMALVFGLAFSFGAAAQLLHGVTDSLSGGGTIVNPCTGVIDLSSGCPQPMLGVF